MLTKEQVEKFEERETQVAKDKAEILKEINRVFAAISKGLGYDKNLVKNFWFPDAPEGSIGDISTREVKEKRIIFFEQIEGVPSKYYHYFNGLYSDYLYMTDDEIISSISDDIEKEEKRKEKEKHKLEEKKLTKKALAEQAKAKLSPEERKALGV